MNGQILMDALVGIRMRMGEKGWMDESMSC